MNMGQKYSVYHYLVSALLNYLNNKATAIPGHLVSFRLDTAKVRDLSDSIY